VVLWLSDNEAYRAGLEEMFATGIPVVALGNGIPATPFPVDAVLSDFTQGLTEAVEALGALGHRRFAFLSALAEGQNDGGRPRLFRELLNARGVTSNCIAELRCGHSVASARDTFAAFLQQHSAHRPTALVAVNDLSAIGAMRAARDAGLEVPRDLSIVGVDDVPLGAYLPVALSSIRQRYRKITRTATEMLLARIEHPDDPALGKPRQVVFPTLFVRRESVGTAPAS